MKNNLVTGIFLIGIVMLSSCAVPNQLAVTKNSVYNDDVYYTRAKAGDKIEDMVLADNQTYNGDDDYYYYGDYASRINRFANNSPFDYNDDFYYSYVPYNNGFGQGTGEILNYYDLSYGNTNPSQPVNNSYVYSPYDYGYSPFFDYGYDDFGYGAIYGAFIGGGGGGGYANHHHHSQGVTASYTGLNATARGIRTTQSPGVTRVTAYYPGNPLININRNNGFAIRNGNVINPNNTAARQTRDNSYRPTQNSSQPSSVSSSGSVGGGSSAGASGGGGGGRPVRP